MKKRTRYLIFLGILAFSGFFLWPTYRWYVQFNEQDKEEARLTGAKLQNEVTKQVDEVMNKFENGEFPEKEYNILNKAFKDEIKYVINKKIEQEKIKRIVDPKKYGKTFDSMETVITSLDEGSDSFFIDSLVGYYTNEGLSESEAASKAAETLKDFQYGEKHRAELKHLQKDFAERMKSHNEEITKVYNDRLIEVRDMYTYSEMKSLLASVSNPAYAENFFRDKLEDHYINLYEKKKKVKDNIIKLGLDLQGGAYAVVTIKFNDPRIKAQYPDGIDKETREAMIDTAVQKIQTRIDKYGVSETSIQKLRDQNQIVINLPGVKEANELRQLIERMGVLEFKLVSKTGSDDLNELQQRYARLGKPIVDSEGNLLPEILELLPPDTEALKVSNKNKFGIEEEQQEYIVVETNSLLGKNVKIDNATVGQSQMGNNVVNFTLSGEAANKWAEITGNNVGRQIAIILDNMVLQSPTVNEKITGGKSQITLGNTPVEDLRTLALILRTGSLDVPLQISEENSVGPSLGRDTIQKGLMAVLIGSILVLAFMIIWYSAGGFIADIAMALNLVLLMSGLALFNGTLTLPGIAGIILTVGMAVDANVIIFERIKEEFRTGKTFKTSVQLGFSKTFWTVLDANITTFFAALGVALFGTGPIKGFAVTLCMGIISSLFTALFVSRLIFESLTDVIEFKSLRVLSLLRRK